MAIPADKDELWNEAMALLLIWQAEPESARAREAIRQFCARGPDHRAAWDEAKRIYHVTGKAVGASPRPKSPGVTRRRLIISGVGVVAVGAAALQAPAAWRRWTVDEATGIGEVKKVQLSDGSWLTVGPSSAVDVAYSNTTRRIVLHDGMILCEIARDAERPFVAEAGQMSAASTGTTLELRREADWSLVAVEKGQVDVTFGKDSPPPISVAHGEWTSLGPGPGQIRRGQRESAEIAAWRDRLLVAEREQVSTVVASIGRWRRGKIVIAEAALAAGPVSGLFDLTDPDAALAAVVAPYGGKVRHLSPWLVVLTTL